ncbi:MAG: DUF6398 domain-containing protein [Actinomycetota bacterium]
MPRSEKVPEALQDRFQQITTLTDQFCAEHLNAEYAKVCREMTAALARKRPSPLLTGKIGTWACGIVYTVGRVNFLTDRTQTPHMRNEELCAAFGLRPATGSAKSKEIKHSLKISGAMDPEWTLPSRLDSNPLAWMVSVNGFVLDARHLPYEIQVEAAARGLIPYVPEPQE